MTREEARKNIIAFAVAYTEEEWPLEIGESLGMAISALGQDMIPVDWIREQMLDGTKDVVDLLMKWEETSNEE